MTEKELHEFVSEFRAGILPGGDSYSMCFAVCAPLQALLSFHGVETELIEGDFGDDSEWWHHWLKLSDGRIIDPTADQFSTHDRVMPEVYIGPLPEWYREGRTR